MRELGIVYTPLMAVLGLLFIVLSFFTDNDDGDAHTMLIAGAILSAGACVAGALRGLKAKDKED